ncbi:hypothetical protein E2C01_086919 [Portunus trituberculatus]|uniref:Uncharacterized protein n=1 Tax=Portunus trituberculatus TaxID=210409 RepID=A0A5B7JFX9_PORTR|nr:hypothetical protein [Portunus trituberculatus]
MDDPLLPPNIPPSFHPYPAWPHHTDSFTTTGVCPSSTPPQPACSSSSCTFVHASLSGSVPYPPPPHRPHKQQSTSPPLTPPCTTTVTTTT